MKVETYTNGWQTQAEMLYDGLGNRLQMTGYAGGQSMTTQYELDNGRVLSADAAGNVTYYLYGVGLIGEQTSSWNYLLPDGSNTPRQLTDINGSVTLSVSYNPWGNILETLGIGNFTQGYFGGIMDAATGLIYVGNGQYYDPATGRFLTRQVNPNSTNPYVPWNFDPAGSLIGPLALLSLLARRKRGKPSKIEPYLFLLVLLVVLPLSVGLACGQPGPGNETPVPSTETPPPNETPGSGNDPGSGTPTPPPPTETPDMCGDGTIIDVKNIIIFGGSWPGAPDGQGPTLFEQMNAWLTDRHGNEVKNTFQYLGFEDKKSSNPISGKARQARDAQSVGASCDAIIIGYSAGTEAALMYARWRVSQGYGVRAVVLLGPTYVSFHETQNPWPWWDTDRVSEGTKLISPLVLNLPAGVLKSDMNDGRKYYDWSEVMNGLMGQGVYILAWYDSGSSWEKTNFSSPSEYYKQENKRATHTHYLAHGNSTNNGPDSKNWVYDELEKLYQKKGNP